VRVAFALPVPSAGAAASSLSRTVKVSKKASCKKANNLRKKVFELGTYVKRVCSSSGSNFTESEQCEMLFDVRLRGTAFTAPLPSFDAEFPVKGTVTGHTGASGAGGQGQYSGRRGQWGHVRAATFSFSIPKVREVRGFPPGS
jgi:hypothetical protein